MGRYINSLPDGSPLAPQNKAEAILKGVPGARVINTPTEFQDDLVCVVQNGPFDAAAFAFSENEMLEFITGLNGRKAHWLIVPNAAQLAR